MFKPEIRPYVVRFLIIALGSIAFVLVFNEVAYFLIRDEEDRAPLTHELVIPAGTAGKVAAGEDVPTIPAEMSFVLGDVLQVRNEDDVAHQLGPIWVPPGSTGKLVIDTAEQGAFQCSFATSKYLGFEVRAGTTAGTRLIALGIAAPTTAVLIFLYSLLMFPVKTPGAGKPKVAG